MSRRSIVLISSLALTCAATIAAAQNAASPTAAPGAAPATTGPATAPASSIPTDHSTPRSALRVLADAMAAGDAKAILGVFYASNPQEQKMAQAMVDVATSYAGLQKDAVAAFGTDSAKVITGDTAAIQAQGLARLASATEKVEGDKATVIVGDGTEEPPVSLVKHEGKWKWPVSEMAKGIDAAQIEQGIADAATQAKLYNEAAEEVRAGKFKTAGEVRQAMEQRVMQMALARHKAVTQPATAPAGQGGAGAPAPAAPAPAAPAEPKPAP
jgi:hypothetical protein